MSFERRKNIIETLMKQGFVRASQLAQDYGVNIATIRRDLKSLSEEYKIELCYGGAKLVGSSFVLEQRMDEKVSQNVEAKMRIAQKAAALIADGDSIALNAGSTVNKILDYLADLSSLTLVTPGLNIAVKASQLPFVNLIIPGGVFRHSSEVLEGAQTEQFLNEIYVDKAFFGATAIDLEMGWTHPLITEVAINRILMKNARKKFLVADTSKFDKVSLAKIADLSEFDAIITDGPLPPHFEEYVLQNKMEVI